MQYHYENLAVLWGDKYPSVFRYVGATLPSACGPGWLSLIETFCALTHKHNERTGSDVQLFKVTEKFGALHLMVRGGSPQVAAFAEFVYSHSMRVCEVCGGEGVMIFSEGWQRTRCEAHKTLGFTLSSSPFDI